MNPLRDSFGKGRGGSWIETFAQDVRFALRVLRKSPGFAAVAVLTLALGIGATTAVFSVVYGVLLRPLPYPNSDRIVALFEVNYKGGQMHFADPNFSDLRAGNRSLEAVAEYGAYTEAISGGAQAVRGIVADVSADFFRAIGVEPAMGRGFEAADETPGAAPVAMVSYGFWRQELGASQDLSPFKLRIADRLYSVAGVMPAGFSYPGSVDVWFPRGLDKPNPSRTAHNWSVIGRLRDGVTLAEARTDISAVGARILRETGIRGNFAMRGFTAVPLQDSITGSVRPALLILMGAVGFLLLVACANVANLLLSQASARERELAIRAALGADRTRLVRQLLTEALLLSVSAGLIGVAAAFEGVRALVALAPANLPRLDSVSVSVPVLLFSLGISLAVALGLGLFTALRATAAAPQGALAEGGRQQAGTLRGQRLGRAIVMAQLAITLALVVGAGLLARSLLRVLSVNPGFRTERILTMELAMPPVDDPASKIRQIAFNNTLFERLSAIPGVSDVSAACVAPLVRGLPNGTFAEMNPGQEPKHMEDLESIFKQTARAGEADDCTVTDSYFRVMGIPLIRGRMFDERDTESAPHVALISESLARVQWPGQDPIGHMLEFGNMDGDLRLLTIVGIVADVHEGGLESPIEPTVYVNMQQRPDDHFTVLLRTDADPTAVFAAARTVMHDLAPDSPPRFRTFVQIYSASISSRRFNVSLMGVFAAAALLLAIAGTYGVMAYSVTRRTREIGVRMALGASRADVMAMVLGQGIRTAAVGVAIGIAGALALTRLMQSMLFGVTANDPLTFAGAAIVLSAVALLACYVPARRAMRVDPMVALRHE
jgi:predicted permease